MHIFEITFDNNDKGDYLSKKNPQESFKEGQEIEYTIIKKENGQYVNYQIRPVQQFAGNKGNPIYDHKRTALRCATDLAAAGKIEVGKIKDFSESFLKFLNS